MMSEQKSTDREALKKLRDARKTSIGKARKTIKDQNRVIKSIKGLIKTEGKTVPEIAHASQISTSRALWYIMALKKYGLVVEGAKDGDYFKYQLAAQGDES
jgi:predicted transcriptional regulator